MLCESCHTNEATVHIASVMFAATNVEARHFCNSCAQTAPIANPVLSVTARNLPPVHVKAVTSMGRPAKVKVQSVEKHLADLDPIWEAFCKRHGYRFIAGRDLWPNRAALAHAEVDHNITLTMDVPFAEMLAHGFSSAMPWSLYALAAIPFYNRTLSQQLKGLPALPGPQPVLTFELFRQVPFSELASTLEAALEKGFSILSKVTREDIVAKGEVPKGKPSQFRYHPW